MIRCVLHSLIFGCLFNESCYITDSTVFLLHCHYDMTLLLPIGSCQLAPACARTFALMLNTMHPCTFGSRRKNRPRLPGAQKKHETKGLAGLPKIGLSAVCIDDVLRHSRCCCPTCPRCHLQAEPCQQDWEGHKIQEMHPGIANRISSC